MKRKGVMKWLTVLTMLALVICLLPVTADAITVKGDYGITFSAGTLYCNMCNVASMSCTDLEISQFSLSGNKLSVTYTFTLHHTHTYTVTEVYEHFYCMTSYSEQNIGVLGPLKFSREAGHFSNNWTSNGDGTHTGICAICGKEETAACSGDSNANCSTEGTCTACGGKYTVPDNHAYSWKNDGSRHWQECAHNAAHKSNEGTCAVGSTGTAATCTNAAVCGTCGKGFGSTDAAAHAWGNWTHGEVDANHTRTCSLNPAHIETGPHTFDYAVDADDAGHLYGTCKTCGYLMEANLEYNNHPVNYNGRPLAGLHIRYSDNWVGEKVADSAIVYKDNIKAGEATGTVTVAGVKLTGKFNIAPTTLTVTAISAQSRAYDGTDKITVTKVTFTGKLGDDDVGIRFISASVGSALVGTYENIVCGETDLELTGADKDNYKIILPSAIIPVTEPVVISPREITATITAKGGTYGKVTAPKITFNGLLEQDASCAVVTYEGTTEKVVDGEKVKYQSSEAPTGAGTYTVKVAVDSNNYKLTGTTTASFKIAKAPTNYDAPKANKLTYNGAEQALLTAGTIRGNSNSFQYKKENDKQWGTTIPTAKNAGTDVILWSIAEDENHLGASGKVKVAIDPATLTIVPDADQEMTYGGKLPELTYTVKGAVAPEVPAFTGKLAVFGKNAGTYEISQGSLKLKDKDTFKASNYELKLEKVKFTIHKAFLTVKAEDQTIIHGSAINDGKYETTRTMYEDLVTVTLTPSTANITYSGIITPAATVEDIDGNDVTDNYTVNCKTGKLVIEPDLSAIKDLTIENVNADAADGIKALQAALNKADTTKATTAQKKQIEDAKVTCATLLVQISEVTRAAQTDAIQNTAGITAENVKLEEEAAIRQAIGDLEKAVAAFGGNYTDADKEKINGQIAQLKDAANAIENARKVIDILAALPETIKAENPQSAGARAAITLLTEHERELVSASGSGSRMAAVAYKFLSGDGSIWDGKEDLVFEIDGDCARFAELLIDGKPVSRELYEADSGSTVITLKKAWLKKASSKDHTITVRFDDGQVSGVFHLHEDALSSGGGFFLILIWILLALATVTLSAAAYLHFKKK